MNSINIVIPMAGQGSRFVNAGYAKPKPFIELDGVPLIEVVLRNLRYNDAKYILIARSEHLVTQADAIARIRATFDVEFVCVDKLTEGAACTVLHARNLINNGTPLMLANSDQYVDGGIGAYIDDAKSRRLDGSIMCFKDPTLNPKWSFARMNSAGLVTEVREKRPISEFATVGLYFFAKGSYFVDGAIDMIARNDRVNNEFYTCPVYNYCIANGSKVGVFEVPCVSMHGLGTPEDLQIFINAGLGPGNSRRLST